MSEIWSEETCPHCSTDNFVNLGDMNDVTAPDVEVIQCWKCKGKFIRSDFYEDINDTLMMYGYESEEEMLRDGYDRKGKKPPTVEDE